MLLLLANTMHTMSFRLGEFSDGAWQQQSTDDQLLNPAECPEVAGPACFAATPLPNLMEID